MSRVFRTQQDYRVVNDKDPEHGLAPGIAPTVHHPSTTIVVKTWVGCLLATAIGLSAVTSWLAFFGASPYPWVVEGNSKVVSILSTHEGHSCGAPMVRQEWRALSKAQKLDYIGAVQCLASKPSILHPNVSLYDDFPWVHKHHASQTHLSPAFLPWHREYIHLYETALKEQCGMQGNLPYWDWSLDWKNPAAAPVWDEDLGLGGDGDVHGPETVGDGRCVTTGPFASLEPKYFDGDFQPHCLSRGFPSQSELQVLGELIQPAAVEAMMQKSTYSNFEEDLEKRAHHFLSHSVRGDLSRFTGPNDPVFFLHHANIDRLWWRWQQIDPVLRHLAYDGSANDREATLEDILDMARLGSNLPVAHVMQTDSQRYCYTY